MSDYLDSYTAAVVAEFLKSSDFDLEDIGHNEMPQFDIIDCASKPATVSSEAQATNSETTRFRNISFEDIDTFLEENENINTKKKTINDVRLFKTYLINTGETKEIENLTAAELNEKCCTFLLSIRKKDGNEYEPSTLKGIMCSIDRHLRMKNSLFSINKDPQFDKCRRVLTSKQKQLKSLGYGNKPNASDELTDADIEKLFNCGLLGVHAPQPLINLLHLTLCMQLGMRGGKEQKDLKLGDVIIEVDASGQQYLTLKKERQTKTRQGNDPSNTKKIKTKAWAKSDKNRCPVNAFRIYCSKRPEKMKKVDSEFYLTVNHISERQDYHAWFKETPMGINYIYGLTKKMISQCPSIVGGRKLTNHSARKHLIQKLQDKGVENPQIMQISGHKNVTSINSYSRLNEHQQKSISDVLSDTTGETIYSATTNQQNQTNKTIMPQHHEVIPSHPTLVPQASYNIGFPSSSTQMSSDTRMQSYFHGNTHIHGGTFNFITNHTSEGSTGTEFNDPLPKKKFKRIVPLNFSDSDSD